MTPTRGIIMQADSVRAILAGRKTQTRRLVKPQPPSVEAVRAKSGMDYSWFTDHHASSPNEYRVAGSVWAVRDLGGPVELRCPWTAGGLLYVKEAWWSDDTCCLYYRADMKRSLPDEEVRRVLGVDRWRSPLFMPRMHARLWLRVTSVRVEQLQSITEEDARAEGVEVLHDEDCWSGTHRLAYEYLWGKLHGFHGEPRARAPWSSNPHVWVVSFERTAAPS